MMIVTRYLEQYFIGIADHYGEELLSILIVTSIGPHGLQSPFKFHTQVDVACKNELLIWARALQLFLYPIKLVYQLSTLLHHSLVLKQIHDSVESQYREFRINVNSIVSSVKKGGPDTCQIHYFAVGGMIFKPNFEYSRIEFHLGSFISWFVVIVKIIIAKCRYDQDTTHLPLYH